MYPFWKGRSGNINLVTVKVSNFAHLERHADPAGRHRLQMWAPRAGVTFSAQVTLTKSLNFSAKNANNITHLFAAED